MFILSIIPCIYRMYIDHIYLPLPNQTLLLPPISLLPSCLFLVAINNLLNPIRASHMHVGVVGPTNILEATSQRKVTISLSGTINWGQLPLTPLLQVSTSIPPLFHPLMHFSISVYERAGLPGVSLRLVLLWYS